MDTADEVEKGNFTLSPSRVPGLPSTLGATFRASLVLTIGNPASAVDVFCGGENREQLDAVSKEHGRLSMQLTSSFSYDSSFVEFKSQLGTRQ